MEGVWGEGKILSSDWDMYPLGGSRVHLSKDALEVTRLLRTTLSPYIWK